MNPDRYRTSNGIEVELYLSTEEQLALEGRHVQSVFLMYTEIEEIYMEFAKKNHIKIQIGLPSASTSTDVQNGDSIHISQLPVPVCSCTGVPRKCSGWGGEWQSSCCTTRLGAHVAGRKITRDAYANVLRKLIAEGYNLCNPVDLKNHWTS